MKCGQAVRLAFLIVIAAAETAFLAYLWWINQFDGRFFTYVNKLTFLILLWVLIGSNIDYTLFQWAVTALLPFMTGCAIIVSVGVTGLVYFRPMLFIRDLDIPLDESNVATVHTGDWLLHQLPLLEVIVIAFCIYREMSCAMRHQLIAHFASTGKRALVTVAICLAPAVFVLVYCSCAPFVDIYLIDQPTPFAAAEAWLPITFLLIVTALASVLVYFIFFHVIANHAQAAFAGQTLTVKARPALQSKIAEDITQWSLNR
jgi:hypothetical protein